jgi:hypothetical protein
MVLVPQQYLHMSQPALALRVPVARSLPNKSPAKGNCFPEMKTQRNLVYACYNFISCLRG